MPTFHDKRRVHHSARQMFQLVAAVEDYPEFVPLCEDLTVRKHEQTGAHETLVADMTVAYKFFRETFTSKVTLDERDHIILVEYLGGPFRHMENRWKFHTVDEQTCDIEFYISYEFSSRSYQLLIGAMFDKAFRKLSVAFEERADEVYGVSQTSGSPSVA